jgi:hypothetical protein
MMGVAAEHGTLPDGLTAYTAPPAPTVPSGSTFVLQATGHERSRAMGAGLRAGRVWIADSGAYFDAAAARAATVDAAPGSAWTPVESVPQGAVALKAPRVGIYKSWHANMDEGWTRFVIERHGFEPRALDNKTIRAGHLRASFDAIVLPDEPREVIATGEPKREEGEMRYAPPVPPEYAGGLDKEGAAALRDFVAAGGTLVGLARASEYLIDELKLPVRNALARAPRGELLVPGSLVRVHVVPGHPVTHGLPAETAVFVDEPLAFETALPGAEMERTVLAHYPADRRDILLSGYLEGEERLARRAAAVALTLGQGRIVLLGFRPQHRAQTEATFPLLLNALWWSVMP